MRCHETPRQCVDLQAATVIIHKTRASTSVERGPVKQQTHAFTARRIERVDDHDHKEDVTSPVTCMVLSASETGPEDHRHGRHQGDPSCLQRSKGGRGVKVLDASRRELLRQDGDQRRVGQPHERPIEISPRVADTSVGLIQRAHHRSLGPRAGVLCKQYSFPLTSMSRMSYS